MRKWYEILKRPYVFHRTPQKRNIFQLIIHIISDYHLPESYHQERIEKYAKRYEYLKKTGKIKTEIYADGPFDFGILDAYDEGYVDYRKYIEDNNLVEKEIALFHNHTLPKSKKYSVESYFQN